MAVESSAAGAAAEDARLMARIQAADEAAFAALMQRWERPVKAVIGRIVLNVSEAEDLAQETFARVWLQRAKFTPGRPVKPWLLGIAINLARNRLRWWKRRPAVALDEWMQSGADVSEAELGGAATLERQERAAAVRDAIAALRPRLREALVLFEYEGLSYSEVAQTLVISEKAAENRILRAREALRTALRT